MGIIDQIKALAVRVGQEFGQYVSLTTDQTITGVKTFTNSIVGDLTGTADRALSDASGNNIADTYMDLSSPQTITGQKIFVDMVTADSLVLTGPDGIKYTYTNPEEEPDWGDDWDWSEWTEDASLINEVSPISTYSLERTNNVSTASLNTVMKLATEKPAVYANSPSVTLTQGIVTPTNADKNYKFRVSVTVGSVIKDIFQAGIDMSNGKLFLRYPNTIPNDDNSTQIPTTEWVTNRINSISSSTMFTKTEIEQMFSNLNNIYLTEETLQQYLTNTNVTIKNIYTKEEINNLLSNIDLSEYYTKTQIDNMINGLGNTYLTESTLQQYLSNNDTTIKNVYNKEEINQLINNIDLSKYYTKIEVDNLISSLGNTYLTESDLTTYLSNNNVIIKNVYTKDEIIQLLNNIDLSNYYTKNEITDLFDNLDIASHIDITSITQSVITSLSQDTVELNTLLIDYYTKTQVDNLIANYEFETVELDDLLTDYYTKAEVNSLIDGIDVSEAIDTSSFVTTNTFQTISGAKRFTSRLNYLNSRQFSKGTVPGAYLGDSTICFDDKDGNDGVNRLAFIQCGVQPDGAQLLRLAISKNEAGTFSFKSLDICHALDGSFYLNGPSYLNDHALNNGYFLTSAMLRQLTGNTSLNAASATKATQDALGRVISDTYVTNDIITYGTTALVEGTSTLATGHIYCQYED